MGQVTYSKVQIDALIAGAGGDALPIVDSTAVVKGSSDATKLVRIEADTNVPTGTTVTLTSPEASGTLVTTAGAAFVGPVTIVGADGATHFSVTDAYGEVKIRYGVISAASIYSGGTIYAIYSITGSSLNLGGATVLDFLSATAALDFGSIAAGASADLTITVTGAVAGDSVILGRPAAEDVDLETIGFVSASDTVTVRAYNNDLSTAVDQASLTYRATVIRL